MTAKRYLSRWRSPEAEQRFRAMEDELWAEHPRHPEPLDVETERGTTRGYHWPGPGDPIVFLHGIGGTSLLWARYAEALETRNVWSIDILGDAGRSVQRVPYVAPDEMGKGVGGRARGLRHRAGPTRRPFTRGLLALNLTIRRPSRVASAVLLDPVGIGDLHMLRFMLWGVPVLLGAFAPARVRRWQAKRFRMPLLDDKRAIRLALYGQMNHPPRIPRLLPFTDDELRSIAVPVTVLIGEKTEPFDADEVSSRAKALIPHANVELVPNGGHAFPVDHVELVLSYLATGSTEGSGEVKAVEVGSRLDVGEPPHAEPVDQADEAGEHRDEQRDLE
jgi:pimeloyl-ACP methyl ester carboxylesterase